MSPEAPLLKALAFTLMGLPKVPTGCVPIETGTNTFNLPLISNSVNYAISTCFYISGLFELVLLVD